MSLNQGDDGWGTFPALGPTATAVVLQLRLLANLPQTFISIRQLRNVSPKKSLDLVVHSLLVSSVAVVSVCDRIKGCIRTGTSFTTTRKMKCDERETMKRDVHLVCHGSLCHPVMMVWMWNAAAVHGNLQL